MLDEALAVSAWRILSLTARDQGVCSRRARRRAAHQCSELLGQTCRSVHDHGEPFTGTEKHSNIKRINPRSMRARSFRIGAADLLRTSGPRPSAAYDVGASVVVEGAQREHHRE